MCTIWSSILFSGMRFIETLDERLLARPNTVAFRLSWACNFRRQSSLYSLSALAMSITLSFVHLIWRSESWNLLFRMFWHWHLLTISNSPPCVWILLSSWLNSLSYFCNWRLSFTCSTISVISSSKSFFLFASGSSAS